MVYAPHVALIRAAYDGGALVDAVFYDDGEKITVTWPNGRGTCVASPEVVEGFVDQINELRRKLDDAQGSIRALVGVPASVPVGTPGAAPAGG